MLIAPLALVVLLMQETQPAAWTSHRQFVDNVSTALVALNVGGDIVSAWRRSDRKHALGCAALRDGIVVGSSELAKALVHRTRPDGSDRKSFFSEHTALAMVNTGWRYQVSIPIAIGAGYGRAAAAKHYATDILTGAGVGVLTARACK